MSYQLRSNRRIVNKAKKRFIYTIIFCLFLLYATITWILPSVIGGVSSISQKFKKPLPVEKSVAEDATMAPPVINIPYESTNSAQINISGYSTPGNKVEIYLNDSLDQTIDVDSNGLFTAVDVSLNDGTNTVYGKTVDNDKRSLASKTLNVVLNSSKPKLNISEPNDGKEINGGDKKVTVSGKTDLDSKVYINDGQVIISKDGSFTTSISLNDGDNIITIKAVNEALTSTIVELKVIYKSPESSPTPTPSPSN